jgi:class 3 adenylate cyclase
MGGQTMTSRKAIATHAEKIQAEKITQIYNEWLERMAKAVVHEKGIIEELAALQSTQLEEVSETFASDYNELLDHVYNRIEGDNHRVYERLGRIEKQLGDIVELLATWESSS